MTSLDADTIAKLLASSDKPKRTSSRRKKDVRDTVTWFALDHNITSECAIPDHEDRVNSFSFRNDADLAKALSRSRVVALVNGAEMCRYCFLSGASPLDTGSQGE